VRAVPRLGELYPGICLKTEEKVIQLMNNPVYLQYLSVYMLVYNKQFIIQYTRYEYKSILPLLLQRYENNPFLFCGQPNAVRSFLYPSYALFMILQTALAYVGRNICLRIYFKEQ
jgi:hypothetical protein